MSKKPLFLKSTMVASQVMLLPISGQSTTDRTGKIFTLDPKIMATPKMNLVTNEGEIFATDSITLNSNGWYVTGSQVLKITNSSGITIDGLSPESISGEQHTAWIEDYKVFITGGELDSGDGKKIKTMSYIDTFRADASLKPPTIEDDGWYVDTDLWYHLIRQYGRRKNTLLIGDSGAGKTDLLRILFEKIKKPLDIFDMAISNPNKALCGNLRALNGSTHFQYARFATAIQYEGGVLLDELSRANPTANNILLPVLDKRRTLYIEDAIEDTEIKLHEKCMIMATANIGTKFIGTSTLDHALLNRFDQVGVSYPPDDKESLLLQKVHGLTKFNSDKLISIARDIRQHEDLSKDISTRQLMSIAEMMADGYTMAQAFEWTVMQQFESDKSDGGERQQVNAIISSYH